MKTHLSHRFYTSGIPVSGIPGNALLVLSSGSLVPRDPLSLRDPLGRAPWE